MSPSRRLARPDVGWVCGKVAYVGLMERSSAGCSLVPYRCAPISIGCHIPQQTVWVDIVLQSRRSVRHRLRNCGDYDRYARVDVAASAILHQLPARSGCTRRPRSSLEDGT
jgi:hypothetical protein